MIVSRLSASFKFIIIFFGKENQRKKEKKNMWTILWLDHVMNALYLKDKFYAS